MVSALFGDRGRPGRCRGCRAAEELSEFLHIDAWTNPSSTSRASAPLPEVGPDLAGRPDREHERGNHSQQHRHLNSVEHPRASSPLPGGVRHVRMAVHINHGRPLRRGRPTAVSAVGLVRVRGAADRRCVPTRCQLRRWSRSIWVGRVQRSHDQPATDSGVPPRWTACRLPRSVPAGSWRESDHDAYAPVHVT